MKLKYILFLAFFCFYNYSYSSEFRRLKKEAMVNQGIKGADIIFYGELIKIDTINKISTFRILELFKGNYNSKIINAKSDETDYPIYPLKKDLWIVYALFNKDKKTITLDLRSPTQTMEIGTGFLPPVPIHGIYGKKITKLDSIICEVENLKIRNETLSTFFYQLELLRAYKSSQNIISEKEKTELKIESYSKYIIISLIVNILLFSFLIFIILKKKIFIK
ncbi:hypothetical protein OA93_22375 [Flavobacterium sp. KMS]|nr:hypothetical protein OA93_22375 [Flavobacterium sp. KMS]KIC00989.1 hypothetical protein OA88_16340 [Flavobacterium sp. JRM]